MEFWPCPTFQLPCLIGGLLSQTNVAGSFLPARAERETKPGGVKSGQPYSQVLVLPLRHATKMANDNAGLLTVVWTWREEVMNQLNFISNNSWIQFSSCSSAASHLHQITFIEMIIRVNTKSKSHKFCLIVCGTQPNLLQVHHPPQVFQERQDKLFHAWGSSDSAPWNNLASPCHSSP